ncbi:LysR substrate-binding domain-containing protein [Palleronia sp. LCG004]|uniref:LysR substrate-binding domain-containing protein n=1 Tax=Palleronia sp. LCG004 TaxID=3079304 RepID=UPI002943095D|nr:LysR substrate-binding domain-containing protein [Palleronia sp. LCG004]WOI57642.1 LysR substrate-binding domain-containing protein [Palleronia sp. LCG004]
MTFAQLLVFIEVARREHVTDAARALNMTQSAVSAAISAMEERHGVKLFERVGRRIALSAEGRSFLPGARRLVDEMRAAERVLADLADGTSGTLAIQASQTVASYWLPPILMRHRKRFPGVEIALSVGNTTSVAEAVEAGRADLGIVEGDIGDSALIREPVAIDRLSVVAGAGHEWADGRILGAADLAAASWILRENGSGTRAALEADLAALGIDPGTLQVALELPSNEACAAALVESQAITALSERAVRYRIAEGSVVRLPVELPGREFSIVRDGKRSPTRAVTTMMAFLREAERPGRVRPG